MDKVHITLLLLLIFVASSCHDEVDNDIVTTMEDGKTIIISSEIHFYSTEEEFVHNVSFPSSHSAKAVEFEELNYSKGTLMAVYGYNNFSIQKWEKTKLGSWCEKYGLKPNNIYYVGTKVYDKYVSKPPEHLRIVPKYEENQMGYCPLVDSRFFEVLNEDYNQCTILRTGVRYIGYDSKRNPLNIEIPLIFNNKNNLTWKFSIQDDGWD